MSYDVIQSISRYDTYQQLSEENCQMEDERGKTCSPERITATIPVAQFLQDYVDIPSFLEYCKACPSYERLWSCPPYSLDALEIWNKYETLELVGAKVKPSAELRAGTYANDELEALYETIISEEKGRVTEELLARERASRVASCCLPEAVSSVPKGVPEQGISPAHAHPEPAHLVSITINAVSVLRQNPMTEPRGVQLSSAYAPG